MVEKGGRFDTLFGQGGIKLYDLKELAGLQTPDSVVS
jgi:hypothetical protein